MALTQEQLEAIERGIGWAGGKYMLYFCGVIGGLAATIIPDSVALKAALLVIVGLVLISLMLGVRCLRLSKQLNAVQVPASKAFEPATATSAQTLLSAEAFAILCWIFDEDGQVTIERIVKKLNIPEPEAHLHIMRLYEKCFIRDIDTDHLDAPEGYQIIADGAEYVLKHRGRR
jgi:hypothetical protein